MNGCSLDFVEVEPCKDGVLSGLKQETPGNYYGFHLVRRVKGEANIERSMVEEWWRIPKPMIIHGHNMFCMVVFLRSHLI